MAADLEEQKKSILPFMQRAQEIQSADPKVAYYCRMYGVEQALKIPQRAKEINSLLGAALSQLEKDKAKLDLDPAADRIYCLGFALRIFDNADRVDRAGKATERTSKAYYAASVFIEILNQWEGGVDAELLEKQRYCAWRAAEIRKAIREGRPPVPPPAVESPEEADGDAAAAAGAAAGPGSRGAGLDDLPAASGSSDWAYSGSARMQPPPPGSSGGSFSAGAPPQPPLLPPVQGAPPAYSYTAPAAQAPPPPSLAAAAAGVDGAPAARFWPGARVLVRADEGLEEAHGVDGDGGAQVGTVGQVIPRSDGRFSYKVALRDRLVEVPEEAAVPALQEGELATLHTRSLPPGSLPGLGNLLQQVPVRVLLINNITWPPSFLVQTPDGKELSAEAHALGPPRREGAPAAAPPPPPPPSGPAPTPVQPSPPAAHDHAIGPAYGSFTSTSAPPPPPQPPAPAYPPPHYAHTAPVVPTAPPPSSSPYPSVSSSAAAHQPAAAPPPHAPPPQQQQQQSYTKSYSSPSPSAQAGSSWPAAAATAAPLPTLPPGYKPPLQCITEAQKQAKYAVSALSFEDITTAVKNLSEALRLLTDPAAANSSHARR